MQHLTRRNQTFRLEECLRVGFVIGYLARAPLSYMWATRRFGNYVPKQINFD